MGLFVKKNHGQEYLYSLAGKEQFFLGRKDDPDNLNQDNLNKAIKMIDENFDKQLQKYLLDLDEHTSYMAKNDKTQYLQKRQKQIIKNLQYKNMFKIMNRE